MEDTVKEHAERWWRSSNALQSQVLEAADMLKTAEMVSIEDLDEASLPSTTDADTHMPPAEK
eukprot:9518950-Alexandrium_andersonii.AAC.1